MDEPFSFHLWQIDDGPIFVRIGADVLDLGPNPETGVLAWKVKGDALYILVTGESQWQLLRRAEDDEAFSSDEIKCW